MTPNEQLLQESAHANMAGVTEAIQNGANINATDECGWTAFMNSAWNGDSTMMRFLRSMGADPKILSNDGYSAAHYAARAGRTGFMVGFSIEELNQPDSDGLTPIFHAAIFGHRATFNAMISAGADDTFKSRGGHDCYDYARLFGNKVA